MIWTEPHDEMLCREILTYEPYNFKSGTVQRGEAWKMIAESLNSIENPKFTVNHRSVRERYTILEKNYVKKNNAEEKATGISPDEMSDLDKALEEIVGKFKDLEIKVKQTQEEAENVTKDRETATEMRKKCMETYAETNKRKGEQSNPSSSTTKKSKRRSGDDTLTYLREKMESDKALKEKELLVAQQREQNFALMLSNQQKLNERMWDYIQNKDNSK